MPTPVAEAFITLRPDMSQFKSGVSQFFRVNAVGITAAAAAVVAGITAVVKPAADVEQQLDVLQATTGATSEEMKQLADLAKALGADLALPGTSSKDAAEAMTELAKGGLAVNDVLGASKGVLQLAAAGQLSNASAAEITANALNAFNLAGTEATRVADLLAGAAKSASGTVFDMADSLKMSAAVFAAAGIPIEDLVTQIALLAQNGIQGSDAGTSLKQMLLQVQAPAAKTKKLMAEIGFSIYETNGQMKSARDIIANLAKSTEGMTQQERDFALAQIFGADAVRAANVLLKEGVAGFDAMRGAVTKQGAAAAMSAAQNAGLKGAIDGVKSAISTAAIDLGTKMLPKLTEFFRNVGELINGLHTMGPAVASTFGQVKDIAAPAIAFINELLVHLFNFITANTPMMIATIAALGAAVVLALGPAGFAAAAIIGITALLIGLELDWTRIFAQLPLPVQKSLLTVLEATREWAGALEGVFNAVIFGVNQVSNAFVLSAKVQARAMAGFAIARGDMERAQQLFNAADKLEFNPVESVDFSGAIDKSMQTLADQIAATENIAAVTAFEAAARAAWEKNVGPFQPLEPGEVATPGAPAVDSHDTFNVTVQAALGPDGRLLSPEQLGQDVEDVFVLARDRAALGDVR